VFALVRSGGTKPCEYGSIGAETMLKKASMVGDLEPKAK